MEMALTLLLQAINKSSRNRIDVRDAGMLSMLGGLLPFLVRGMQSRHSTVASTSLRIFSVLVPLPLPGWYPLGCQTHATEQQSSRVPSLTAGMDARLQRAYADVYARIRL